MKINRKILDLYSSSNDEIQRLSGDQGSQPSKRTIAWFFQMARNERLSQKNARLVLSDLSKFMDEMKFYMAELDAELQLAKGLEEFFLDKYGDMGRNSYLKCVINE